MRKGQPPAQWLKGLLALKMKDDVYFEYADLMQMFNISRRSAEDFCLKTKVVSEYYIDENKSSRKKMKLGDLKRVAREYIKAYELR